MDCGVDDGVDEDSGGKGGIGRAKKEALWSDCSRGLFQVSWRYGIC